MTINRGRLDMPVLFVETKKSTVRLGAPYSHLTFLR